MQTSSSGPAYGSPPSGVQAASRSSGSRHSARCAAGRRGSRTSAERPSSRSGAPARPWRRMKSVLSPGCPSRCRRAVGRSAPNGAVDRPGGRVLDEQPRALRRGGAQHRVAALRGTVGAGQRHPVTTSPASTRVRAAGDPGLPQRSRHRRAAADDGARRIVHAHCTGARRHRPVVQSSVEVVAQAQGRALVQRGCQRVLRERADRCRALGGSSACEQPVGDVLPGSSRSRALRSVAIDELGVELAGGEVGAEGEGAASLLVVGHAGRGPERRAPRRRRTGSSCGRPGSGAR